jgi:CRISPR-associated endonuclease Cas1
MAASKTVLQLSSSHNSVVPRHGVVTLFGYGIQVRVDRGHLVLDDGIGADRRHFRLPRVGHGLKRLVVVGADGFVSLSALRWLADQGASFSMLERDGKVLATTGPVSSSDARLRRAQALAHSNGTALRVARELIRQKLDGQANVARYKLGDDATADKIAQFRSDLVTAEAIPSIRLIEAQAASEYWSAWRALSIAYPKKDLALVPDHWLSFGTRISSLTGSPRLATNPPNAVLNFLYAILESEARLAAAAIGLDPGLGVLHVDTPNRDSLALDILEPVRPHIDAYVIDTFLRRLIRKEWFFEERSGNARLMASLTERLSETAPMWTRAVAPVAEWVAQALWSRQGKSGGQLLPTRLTQRRRAEGRGNTFTTPALHYTPRPKICEVCGAEGIKNRYCRSCGVEISRENMTRAAVIGHLKPKTASQRRRISNRLSNHAVANTWWSPSSLPPWLNQEFYVEKIQPKLRRLKVREIAQAMQVSQPYAAFIRSGRRPHPRHWAGTGAIGWRRSNRSMRVMPICTKPLTRRLQECRQWTLAQ